MKTFSMLAIVMMLGVVGCVQGPATESTLTNDHEAEAVNDCFTKLLAGDVKSNGEIASVSFANGACQGTSKALNKLSEKAMVDVVIDGDRFESPLFKEGEKVFVSANGNRVEVATWADDSRTNELSLVSGAKLQLKVGSSIWALGSSASGTERIELILN